MKNLYTYKRNSNYKFDNFKKEKDDSYKHSFFLETEEEKNPILLKWIENIERFQMMYTLCKIRELLIEEKNKGYYRNAANIKEIIELENGIYIAENGVQYTTEQKMQIYQNDFSEFVTIMKPVDAHKVLTKK